MENTIFNLIYSLKLCEFRSKEYKYNTMLDKFAALYGMWQASQISDH